MAAKAASFPENLDRISIYTEETGPEGEHHQFNITWFPDAFAQTMAELIRAVAQGREASHSAASTLPTLATVDAAYASAESGMPIKPSEIVKGSAPCLTNC